MKRYLLIVLLAMGLSACVKAPTLEERLDGKTGTERDKEAYNACLEESRRSGGKHGHSAQGSRFWALCDEMNKVNEKEK